MAHRNPPGLAGYSQLLAVAHRGSRFSRGDLLLLTEARMDSAGYSQLFAAAHRGSRGLVGTCSGKPEPTVTRAGTRRGAPKLVWGGYNCNRE